AGGKVSQAAGDSVAAHPSWRKAIQHLALTTGWDNSTPFSIRGLIRQGLTQETQKLAALVPGFGSYVNDSSTDYELCRTNRIGKKPSGAATITAFLVSRSP
ncbi:10196_t:CDS:2, partial [Acaulospora colombiana]